MMTDKIQFNSLAMHIAAELPLCRPIVPACARCVGTLCTGLLTPALRSAFGKNSRTGDSCPALAQRCWARGSPRGPGRPARSPSRCWSAWSEHACNTAGSHSRPRTIRSHRVSHAKAIFKSVLSQAVTAVTNTHWVVLSPVQSFGIWRSSVCKCHVNRLSDECSLYNKFIPPLTLVSCVKRR